MPVAAVADDPISENTRAWCLFQAWRPGEVLELQALEVPEGKWVSSYFAHATTIEDAIRLDPRDGPPPADGDFYSRHEHGGPARGAPGEGEHLASRSQGLVEGQRIVDLRQRHGGTARAARRLRSVRPRGTSSTAAELEAAIDIAERIHARLVEILGSAAPLGFGHPGNGAAVLVALDSLTEPKRYDAQVKAILTALDFIYARNGVKVDRSVIEPKRLCCAWGLTKQKGDNTPDYPHRITSFACAESVERIGRDGLEKIIAALCSDLTAEQTAEIDKILGIKPTPKVTSRRRRHQGGRHEGGVSPRQQRARAGRGS